MSKEAPELAVHKEWLGQIQQVGLVVSPSVLVKNGVGIERQKSLEVQTRLREIASDADDPRVNTFPEFAAAILEWPPDILAGAVGGPDLPESLTVALPEYEDSLAPSYALVAPPGGPGLQPRPPLALVSVTETGVDLDAIPERREGWRASAHARLERLLRETRVPIGLLFNHTHLRLVYAPKGESSGHLTFRFRHLLEILGRPMAGALNALLSAERVTDQLPDAQRLPSLLRESRKYQNEVSTRLAGQVLAALWELLRGFQRASDETHGVLLAAALKENPQDVYGGLLSTLMRLVFILYAEDRDLMPKGEVYQNHYSVSGLFKRLREDEARYAEGTLGGLVEAANRLDRHLRQAVELGHLCANDPVCAQHQPESWQEERYLHGAACHGCLLLAESSCERRNDFLDRALVVPTVDGADAAFFDEA